MVCNNIVSNKRFLNNFLYDENNFFFIILMMIIDYNSDRDDGRLVDRDSSQTTPSSNTYEE